MRCTSSAEIAEYEALEQIDPPLHARLDYYFAHIAALLSANADAKEWLPVWGRRLRDLVIELDYMPPEAKPEELEQKLDAVFDAFAKAGVPVVARG